MENYWMDRAAIKAEVRAELEEEYKQKLSDVKNEMERALEEGYEEAYRMLRAERNKCATLELRLYDEYEMKLHQWKDFIVGKVDAFLSLEWKKLCEAGEREFANKLAAWRKALSAREMVDLATGDDAFKPLPGEKRNDHHPRPDQRHVPGHRHWGRPG